MFDFFVSGANYIVNSKLNDMWCLPTVAIVLVMVSVALSSTMFTNSCKSKFSVSQGHYAFSNVGTLGLCFNLLPLLLALSLNQAYFLGKKRSLSYRMKHIYF